MDLFDPFPNKLQYDGENISHFQTQRTFNQCFLEIFLCHLQYSSPEKRQSLSKLLIFDWLLSSINDNNAAIHWGKNRSHFVFHCTTENDPSVSCGKGSYLLYKYYSYFAITGYCTLQKVMRTGFECLLEFQGIKLVSSFIGDWYQLSYWVEKDMKCVSVQNIRKRHYHIP